jgi:molybdate transport system substrate-binding protein
VRRITSLVVVAAALAACSRSHGKTVRVAAAADLAQAFDELGKAFEKKTGIKPLFDFGSSGQLSKQIEQGAPYALFAAADKAYVDEVVKAGKCDASTVKLYARGRIVVWTPSGVAAPKSLADLADPRFKKIAIANPAHAPYGQAAQQALQHAGVWDKLQDKLVLGDSIRSTMEYAQTHAVDAAIVAMSLAVVADGGSSLPIDDTTYAPLDQELVICAHGDGAKAARQLVDYIGSPDGREVMTRYGFALPAQTPAK